MAKNRVRMLFERLKTDKRWSAQKVNSLVNGHPVNSDPSRSIIDQIEIELDHPVFLNSILFQLDQIQINYKPV